MVRKNGEGYDDNFCFVVLDDCMDDTSWIHTKVIKSIFKNGRHYDMFFLLLLVSFFLLPNKERRLFGSKID